MMMLFRPKSRFIVAVFVWLLPLNVSLVAYAYVPNLLMTLGTGAQVGGPESACRILIFNKRKKLEWICSGVLVREDQVLTAGHCLTDFNFKKDEMRIECGFIKNSPPYAMSRTKHGVQVYTSGPVFKEILEAKEILLTKEQMTAKNPRSAPPLPNDQAIIRLTKASGLSPMVVASKDERDSFFSKETMDTGIECNAAGFGVVGDGTAGVLRSVRVPSIEPLVGPHDPRLMAMFYADASVGFQAAKVAKIKSSKVNEKCDELGVPKCLSAAQLDQIIQLKVIFHRLSLFQDMAAPGDSGGPLYCRKSSQSPWKLVGLNSQTSTLTFANGDETEVFYTDMWTSVINKEFQIFLKK